MTEAPTFVRLSDLGRCAREDECFQRTSTKAAKLGWLKGKALFVENKTRNVYVRVVCSDSAAEAHYMRALTGSLFTHSGRCLTSSKVKVNHSLKRDDELGAALLMGDV